MALGKGLSSLIPEKRRQREAAQQGESPPENESVFLVDIDRISPNAEQPRRDFDSTSLQELSDSIQEHGVLQPLIVMKHEQERDTGRDVHYEIIAGERRWRAAQMAGLPRVPVIVRRPQENEKLEMALVENVQRDDLNAMEEAEAYRRLMDSFGLTQQAVATRVGKSRSAVANTLRLMELPGDIQKGLREKKITEGHARALLTCDSPRDQQALFAAIVSKGLTVRDVEQRAKGKRASSQLSRSASSVRKQGDPKLRALAEELSEALGTDVSVSRGRKGGKIAISYYSDEELSVVKKKLLR